MGCLPADQQGAYTTNRTCSASPDSSSALSRCAASASRSAASAAACVQDTGEVCQLCVCACVCGVHDPDAAGCQRSKQTFQTPHLCSATHMNLHAGTHKQNQQAHPEQCTHLCLHLCRRHVAPQQRLTHRATLRKTQSLQTQRIKCTHNTHLCLHLCHGHVALQQCLTPRTLARRLRQHEAVLIELLYVD